MKSPQYEELAKAIDHLTENIGKALHQVMDSAYALGQHDAARTIAGVVLDRMDDPNKEDVIEMCRRLWEDDGK